VAFCLSGLLSCGLLSVAFCPVAFCLYPDDSCTVDGGVRL